MKKFRMDEVEERVANTFSLPKDVMLGLLQIHMIGNQELIIENYKGILSCSEEQIRISAKNKTVFICGKALKICYYTERDMKISGTISSILFE
jgi:sporulation protein YqfC